jgi:tetratricopeptide (TPR) repeat protein
MRLSDIVFLQRFSRRVSAVALLAVWALMSVAVTPGWGRIPWFGRRNEPRVNWNLSPEMLQRFEVMGVAPGPFVAADEKALDSEAAARLDARRYYLLGAYLMQLKQFQEAEAAFDKAQAAAPGSILIRLAQARALLGRGQVDACVAICEGILKDNPRDVEARLLAAQAYEQQGQDALAIDAYRAGLEVMPENPSLLEPLGQLYLRRGDIQGVIEIFERIRERLAGGQRHNLTVMWILAQFYELAGQTDQAIETCREMVRVYPGHVQSYTSLASLLLKRERADEALDVCKQGLIRGPESRDLQQLFERSAGSRVRALAAYRRFADEYDQLSEVQLMWAKRALALRDHEAAEEAFGRVLLFDPGHSAALVGLGDAMRRQGRASEALGPYRRAVAARPGDAEAHTRLASALVARGDREEAVREYRAAMAADPLEWTPYLELAELLDQSGDLQGAVDLLHRAVERAQGKGPMALLYERLAEALIKVGQPDKGVAIYRLALDALPGDLRLRHRALIASLKAGDRATFGDLADEGAKVYADNPFPYHVMLSDVFRDMGLRDEEINALREAVAVNPTLYHPWERLIELLTESGRFAEAETTLKQSAGAFDEPNQWRLTAREADLLLRQGRDQEALELLKARLAQMDQQPSADPKVRLGLFQTYVYALVGLGRNDEALQACDDLIAKAEFSAEREPIYQTCGLILIDLDAWDKARVVFERLTALAPENDEYLYFLGAVFEELSDAEKAETALRRAIEVNPDNAEALNHLGYLFAEQGRNLDEALGLVERALALKPKAGHIIDSLGWVHFKKGDAEQALRYLSEAATLSLGDPTVLDHLGDAHELDGDLDNALKRWRQALDLAEKADKPDQGLLARIHSKIESGQAALAAAAPSTATQAGDATTTGDRVTTDPEQETTP